MTAHSSSAAENRATRSVEVLESLFPRCVRVAVWHRGSEVPDLFPEEAAAISNSVEHRRVEFARGRACARAACADLGVGPVAIPVGPGREPIWPPGVVGSITHGGGVIAAVAGYAGQVDGLGVDIEVDGPLESELISDVCTVGEVADIEEARPGELGIWSKVFFSAKESVHKATYPLAHSWLDFGDVELKLDFAGATFTAGLSSTAGPSSAGALGVPELGVLRGSFRLLRGLVWTGVVR